jgi:hypothetical protein
MIFKCDELPIFSITYRQIANSFLGKESLDIIPMAQILSSPE